MLKKKLKLLFLLVVLFVSVATSATAPASAWGCSGTCSGDDCGCYIYAEECRAECQAGPPEYFFDCLGVCRKENIACSKACCGC